MRFGFNDAKVAPDVYDALANHAAGRGLEESLLHRCRLRTAQLGGCRAQPSAG